MIKKLFVCLLLLGITCKGIAQNIDLRLLYAINGPINPADQTWQNLTHSVYIVNTAVPITMLVTGLATHNKELTNNALKTGGAIIITAGITSTIKAITNRERPYLAHPDLITGKATSSDSSFPSGHTSTAFAMATSVSLSFPKWYVIAPAFTYATAVGYSRMYLGVHYPSDVLAGALIGAGSSFLTWKLQKLLAKKHQNKYGVSY
jgi:membrane-associated phospholipid phosphatase